MNMNNNDDKVLQNNTMNVEGENYGSDEGETQKMKPDTSGIEGVQAGQWRQEAVTKNPGRKTAEQIKDEAVNRANIRRLEERQAGFPQGIDVANLSVKKANELMARKHEGDASAGEPARTS